MDVGSEAVVVGEVPAGVVGVFVDDDVVGVPVPAVDVGEVPGGYAEVEASEPEAGGSASAEAPDVGGTEAGGEVAVLPGVVEVVVGIVAAGVVADPAALIDVGVVGVSGGVVEVAVIGRVGSAVEGLRAVGWGCVRGGPSAVGVASFLMLLGHCGRLAEGKRDCEDEGKKWEKTC